MSKITPQDYINAQPELVRAGYLAIKAKAKNTSVAEIAKLYGVSTDVIGLVKLSGAVNEFETIVRLETERQDQLSSLQTIPPVTMVGDLPKKHIAKGYYIVASIILLAIAVGIGWGIVQIVNFIGGLL